MPLKCLYFASRGTFKALLLKSDIKPLLNMNTHKIGRKLESFVASYLKEIDSKSRPSKASGASTELGDIINKYFICECKKRDTDNITIKHSVWHKLCGEIPVGSLRTPIYITQNKHNDTLVSLDLKDFIRFVKFYYKENE